METEINNKTKFKWYHFRRLRITREYCAGTIAGFGLGIVIVTWAADLLIHGWTLIFILGLALISIGSSIQYHTREPYATCNRDQDNAKS
jgi:hypothetical protein